MRKLLLFVLLLTFFIGQTSAQTTKGEGNHLLWRISGNGLTKPSWLFGTMHITDKRVFQFGDSLYAALEKSEGFAAELDMNTVLTHYVNYIIGEQKADKYINDELDEATINKFKSKLEAKYKKPISKITVDDISSEEKKQSLLYLKEGEMKTFMDAYLFDIAERQGKWTGGIEDPEDQFSIEFSPKDQIEDMFEKRPGKGKGLEWMIKTYLNEDLELIDRNDQIWRGAKDIILIKRNVKMRNRMDSLARVRSSFFAVGAAHLPGDSGVVSLLRKVGYTVTPVISSRKIEPEKYTFKEIEKEWVDVMVGDSLFKLKMPVKPEKFKAFDDALMNMLFHFNMASYAGYFTICVPATIHSEEMKDTILSKMLANMKGKGLKEEPKKINVAGESGFEIIMSNEYGEYRFQVFVPGQFIAMNAVFALKKAALYEKSAERFLQSFKPLQAQTLAKSSPKGLSKWSTYTFEGEAFSIDFPGKYINRADKEEKQRSPWKRNSYEVLDITNQSYYAVVCDDSPLSSYYYDDSIYYASSKATMVEAMKGEVVSENRIVINNIPAYELNVKSTESNGDEALTKIIFVNKGNRRFVLLSSGFEGKSKFEEADLFFNSFKFLPNKKSEWKKIQSPDKSFSTQAPGEFVEVKTDDTDEEVDSEATVNSDKRFRIFDAATSTTIYIDKTVFPSFYWISKDSSFLNDRITRNFWYGADSLLEKKLVKNGKLDALDVTTSPSTNKYIKKMRFMWSGDTLYTISTEIPRDVYASDNYSRVFDEFRTVNESKPNNIFNPKKELLQKALLEGDSITFATAVSMIYNIPFTKEDLPFLQKALLHVYRDFDTSYFIYARKANSAFIRKIQVIDSTCTSLVFVKENYDQLTGNKEVLKPYLLELLANCKTQEAYDLLGTLIVSDAPLLAKVTSLSGLHDSLELSRKLFPKLFTVADKEGLNELVTDLVVALVDSSLLSPAIVKEYKAPFIKNAKQILLKDEEELVDESYLYYNYVKLLGVINDAESVELLKKFGKIDEPSMQLEVIIALVCGGQQVQKSAVTKLGEKDEFRFELYERLKKCNKLNIFPGNFLTQRYLAQSKIVGYMYDEEETPEKVSYLEERIIEHNGSKMKVFLFKVMYTEDDPDTHYLGVSGPYSLNEKVFESDNAFTGTIWEEVYDPKKVDEQFERYMKKMRSSDDK